MKEYTERCIKYDQDKALWMRTVFATEKERLMKEYEASLKVWMDQYGPSSSFSSNQSNQITDQKQTKDKPPINSLTIPLLAESRTKSMPIAFAINENPKKEKVTIYPDSSSFF